MNKKTNQKNSAITKKELEANKGLTNKELASKFSTSEKNIKKLLIKYGLYSGKYYTLRCLNCNSSFIDFTKNTKFCKKSCKTQYKNDQQRQHVESFKLHETKRKPISKLNKKSVVLPTVNNEVYYSADSELEKKWLLSVDSKKGIISVKESDLCFKYVNNFSDIDYSPNFEVRWQTGLRWIVEVKDFINENDYAKIKLINSWAKDNRYDYRIVTNGIVKKSSWNKVVSGNKEISIPTAEWVMMSHACSQAMLSPSFRLRVGAIITTMECDSIYSYGFNGDEKGGSNFPACNIPGYDGFIHAEENALLKLNTDKPVKMFITDMPCIGCAKKIINAKNVKEVFYLRPYRDPSGVGLLVKSGIKVYNFQEVASDGCINDSETTFLNMLPSRLKPEYK